MRDFFIKINFQSFIWTFSHAHPWTHTHALSPSHIHSHAHSFSHYFCLSLSFSHAHSQPYSYLHFHIHGCAEWLWSVPTLMCLCMFVCVHVCRLSSGQAPVELCGMCGSVWGELEKRWRAVEDTVSFSGGMSSCVFLFGEAAHGSQKLAGNHMLLTLGPIRRRREEDEGRGGEEAGMW